MSTLIGKMIRIKIVFLLFFIQKLKSQTCPVEYFGQIEGYSCLSGIQTHIFLKSNPSQTSPDIIYTSNYNVLTQINLLTSKTIQTVNTNNNANIIYMANQDSSERSVLVIADTSGCIIEIDVELNAEISRYQISSTLYTFDSTINIDYESQTLVTYKDSNVFFVNYNTLSVFQPNLVGNKYTNSIIIKGASSVLLNLGSKAFLCDLSKNICKSLSLPSINIIYFFIQNQNFFAVYAQGNQGNSITLFSINKAQLTTSRISFMTIPVSINNMILDVSNPSVQFAITIGQYDCRVFNFNTKQMQFQINLMSTNIDFQDSAVTMNLQAAQAALMNAQFNNIYLSNNNLVIASNNFVILIKYTQMVQPIVTATKYISLNNNAFQNVFILPNTNIVLVGDKTLVYLYNPTLIIYILNSCIATYSLDSQIQSQLIQDDSQNSLNSQGVSYQWNKLNGKIIYQIGIFPAGSLFKLSTVLGKIVYYNYSGYAIYDNISKLSLFSSTTVAVQDVQFDEVNFFIYLVAGNNLMYYPVSSTTLVLGTLVQQTGTSKINQIFINPATSQVLVVRSSQAILYNATSTKIAVNTTVTDTFLYQLYDTSLNLLIAHTQTSTSYFIKTYSFPSGAMVQFVNDPTQIYSQINYNPNTLLMTMYVRNQNRIIGWSYSLAVPNTSQQFVIKGLINQIQFYFIDNVGSNNLIIVITNNGILLVYDAGTQDIKYSYTIHNQLPPINFYPDLVNKYVVTYATDNRLVKYDYQNGRLVKQWLLSSLPIGFTVDQQTSMIFVGQKNQIQALSYQGQDMISQIAGFQSTTVPGAFNYQVGQLLSTNNSVVRAYSLYTFQQVSQLATTHTQPILYLAYANNQNLIIVCSQDQTCSVWNCITFKFVQTLQLNQSSNTPPITCNLPTGLYFQTSSVFVTCQSGIVLQWIYNTATTSFQFSAFFSISANPIQSSQSYLEENLILSLDNTSQGNVQYISNQTVAFVVYGDRCIVDKTSKQFITISNKGTVLQYNLQGSLVFNYTVHNGIINQIFSDPQRSQLISIGQSYTHTAPLKTGIFDNQTNIIVVADSQGSILFFNYPLLGLKQMIYSAHSSQIINLNLNKMTNTLMSFGSDSNIKLWNFYAYFKTDFRIMIFQEGSIQDGYLDNQQAITIQQNGMLKMWDFNLQYQMYMQKLRSGIQDFTYKLTAIPQVGKILVNSIAQLFMLNSKSYQIVNSVSNVCNSSRVTSHPNNLFMIFCVNKNQINVFGENLQLTASQPTHTITTVFIFTSSQVNEILNEFAAYTSDSQIVIWKFSPLGVFSSPLIFKINPSSQISAMLYIKITDTSYNILASTFLGNIQVFNYDTVNVPQFIQELDQANNSRQIVFTQNIGDKLFFKRFGQTTVQIFSTVSWNSVGFLVTPCIGYQNRFDYDLDSDLICLSCFGQYNIYTYKTLTLIGNLRIISEFASFGDQNTSNNDDLRIVNGQYIIHARLLYIFIFEVNRSTKTITYLGKIKQVLSFSKVLSFVVNTQPTYTGVEYVFVGTKVSKLSFLLQGSKTCVQNTNIQNLKQTFLSLIDISTRLSTFFVMTNFQFYISLNANQALPQIPQFPYASQSSLFINYDSNQVIQASSFQKFYSSVNGFISVNLKNLDLTFEKQVGQVGVQQLVFYNIMSVTMINCSFESLNGVILSFQQVQNIELNNIQIFNQTFQSVSNPTENSQSQYFFQIYNVTNIKIVNLNITNSSFVSTSLISINNFGFIQSQSTQISSKGIVTINGLYLQNNTIQFSNIASFVDMVFMSSVSIKDFSIIGNSNKAKSLPFKISSFINLELCNTKKLENLSFVENIDFLLLTDNNYFNNKLAGTNTTQYYQSSIDDQLEMLKITIQSNQFTALSSTSSTPSSLVQSFSNNLAINGLDALQNTCQQPCFVNSILSIDNSKNSSLSILQSYSNKGFKQAVISINNSTFKGNSLYSNQNNCSLSGSIVLANSNGTITIGSFQGNICSALNCGAAIYLNRYSNLIMNQVNFIENFSMYFGGALSQITMSSLQINQCKFESNNSTQEGGAIFSYLSTLIVTKSNFENNKSNLNGGAIYSELGTLSLNLCYFIKNFAQNSGGGIYILNSDTAQLEVMNANSNTALNSGGFIFAQDASITLSNSYIENNLSVDGGALYFTNLKSGSQVTLTKFMKNKVNGSGGAIRIDNSDCKVQDCLFYGNFAGAGGAIRYTKIKPSFMIPQSSGQKRDSCNSFSSNTCQSNIVISFGSNICSYPSNIKLLPGKNKLSVIQANSTQPFFQIENMQSGIESVNIQYQLVDEFGDKVKFQSSNFPSSTTKLRILSELKQSKRLIQSVNLQKMSQSLFQELDSYKSYIINNQPSNLENKDLLILRSYITRYDDSQFIIEGIDIIGTPLKTVTFQLAFQGISSFLNQNTLQPLQNINIQVTFRACRQGEAYTLYCPNCILGYCQPCQLGSYILDSPSSTQPQNCTVCNKPFASKCYKSTIHLLPGYWRENNMTDVVAECDQKLGLCNGNERYNYCKQGYMGPICETCDQFGDIWGKSYGNYDILEMKICMTCQALEDYIPAYVFYALIISCLIVFVINDGNSKMINIIQSKILSKSQILNLGRTSFAGKTLIIFKICLFYMQLLTALVKFDIVFENSLKIAKFVPVYLFSPLISMEFWFDCVLQKIDIGVSIQYLRLIWSLILYLMLFILCIIIYLIFASIVYSTYKYEQKYYVVIKYFSLHFFQFASLYFYYIMQHSLLQNFMKILSCKYIGEQYYITGQLNKACNDFEHSMWQILFIIPVFAIVGYAIPIKIFYDIYLNQKNIYKPTNISFIRLFGFLYQEYKPKYWFWELLKLQLRTLIVIFLNAYEDDNKKKACFILIIIIIYSLLAQKNQPYSLPSMNTLDKRSSIISAFLIWIAMVCNDNSDKVQTDFFLTVMAITIILFIVNFIFHILKDLYLRNEYIIAKSRPVQFVIYYAGYILSKELFYAKNKLLIKIFPYLYRIIHCQHLISFEHIQRWRFLRRYIFDFARRRRRDKYAQFYVYLVKQTPNYIDNQPTQTLNSNLSQKNTNGSQKTNETAPKQTQKAEEQLLNSKKTQKYEDVNIINNNSSKVSKKSIKKEEQNQQMDLSGSITKQGPSILKKATSIGENAKEKQDKEKKNSVVEKSEQNDNSNDDDREEIIKKIYPIKRPVMFLQNSYSKMKIDNYKDAQIKDLCENPFYYHDYSTKYKFDKEKNKYILSEEEELKDLRYKICLNNGEKQNTNDQQKQGNNLVFRPNPQHPQNLSLKNIQETPQENQVSMQDLSDVMSEDYNTRHIQEFTKKPIKESELIDFSQDKHLEMLYSPHSNSFDFQSDVRLKSPQNKHQN